ncbi:hypothetical protein [Methylobacterium symbioticum]|uniref:Uncharacterized protein n=1 Tax=Methylobacterium symbioticum TaxID=2584084 RepID=A0A509EGD9_9HYPH|nr:hypothetical protein [Methylobacterium symbioticum]VUD72525.1 hypothetical protein MET9862_03125 [Methylobacterium symbioticum]
MSSADRPLRRKRVIYGLGALGLGCLVATFILLGGLTFKAAILLAGFDAGALGFIVASSRPAWLGFGLREYGHLYEVSICVWCATLIGPAMNVGESFGIPFLVLVLSIALAMNLASMLIYAALFTPAERTTLRARKAVAPS